DMQIKTKIEDDQLSSIDIKSEICPSGDPLAFEDAKQEVDQSEESLAVIYAPNQCTQTGNNNLTSKCVKCFVDNKIFPQKDYPNECICSHNCVMPLKWFCV
ncbi:hypothetical protein L9F63_002097, partial [Diploptera punctata]